MVRKRDRGGTELRTGRVWRSSITTDCHLRTARQPPRLGCGQDEGRTYSGPGPGMEVDSVEGVGAGRKCGCEDIVASYSCSYYFSAYYFSFLPLLLTHTYHPLSLPPLLCTFTPSFLCTIKLSSSFANCIAETWRHHTNKSGALGQDTDQTDQTLSILVLILILTNYSEQVPSHGLWSFDAEP